MKEFYSLREFCLLRSRRWKGEFDSIHQNYSLSKGVNSYAEDIVARYDIAKSSWKEFGDDGPPVGASVITLRVGHGGMAGIIRRFGGVFLSDPKEFFLTDFGIPMRATSILLREFWWAEIRVLKSTETL